MSVSSVRRPNGVLYTELEARTLIELCTMAATEPTLSTDQVDQLLTFAKRQDASGNAPVDADWTPTWQVNSSIALGWEMKAAGVATAIDVQSGRQKIARNQMFTNFMAMADRWRRRSAESVRLPSPTGRSIAGLHNAGDELWDLLWNGGWDDCGDDRHGWAIPGRVQYVDDY